ncbi:unknown [Sinorhizobium phage PBC5]|nr:unknown [Sinorhizobium phage PBC5]
MVIVPVRGCRLRAQLRPLAENACDERPSRFIGVVRVTLAEFYGAVDAERNNAVLDPAAKRNVRGADFSGEGELGAAICHFSHRPCCFAQRVADGDEKLVETSHASPLLRSIRLRCRQGITGFQSFGDDDSSAHRAKLAVTARLPVTAANGER